MHFFLIFFLFTASVSASDVQVGRGTMIPPYNDWGEGAKLRIGNFCSMASDCMLFLGGEHRTEWVSTYNFPAWQGIHGFVGGRTKGDVIIGNDVWIASGALILSGVTIGDGAVVGAKAVVAKDVPPYAIVAGNPARLIRYRFDPETIETLLRIKWWDWSDEEIIKAIPFLLSDDIQRFIQYCEENHLFFSHFDDGAGERSLFEE